MTLGTLLVNRCKRVRRQLWFLSVNQNAPNVSTSFATACAHVISMCYLFCPCAKIDDVKLLRSSSDPSYTVHSSPILVVPYAALGWMMRTMIPGMLRLVCAVLYAAPPHCSLLRYWLLRNIPRSPTITCGCRCNDDFKSESSLIVFCINVQMFVDFD